MSTKPDQAHLLTGPQEPSGHLVGIQWLRIISIRVKEHRLSGSLFPAELPDECLSLLEQHLPQFWTHRDLMLPYCFGPAGLSFLLHHLITFLMASPSDFTLGLR